MKNREYSTKNIDRIIQEDKNVIVAAERKPITVATDMPKPFLPGWPEIAYVKGNVSDRRSAWMVINGKRRVLGQMSGPITIGGIRMDGVIYDFPFAFGLVFNREPSEEEYAHVYPFELMIKEN